MGWLYVVAINVSLIALGVLLGLFIRWANRSSDGLTHRERRTGRQRPPHY